MDTFDLRKYLSEGRLHEGEEDQFEDDLAKAGVTLADEIESELENQKDVEILYFIQFDRASFLG